VSETFLREQIAFCSDYYMQVRPGSREAAACIRDQQRFRDQLARLLRQKRALRAKKP
jgi:hypothetical protein